MLGSMPFNQCTLTAFVFIFQEGKTALYWAVEKGYNEIVRLLLGSEPDLELCTKVSWFLWGIFLCFWGVLGIFSQIFRTFFFLIKDLS